MANGRLSANDVELIYPSSNGPRCDWFGLKQDRETAQVRFLYNTIEDVYFDVVHEVNVNGRNRTISCLNSRGDNIDGCPMCKAGYQQKVLLYIPVYDYRDKKIKIWTRSKNFLSQIQGLMMRNNPLSGTVFEIMRNGAPRDSKTTYLIQPIAVGDGTTVEALLSQVQASIPDPSSYMDVYDFNQMQIYVNNLESLQGNIPANRGGFNQPMPQYGQQYQQPMNNPYGGGYQQPTQQFGGYQPQAPQYGQSTAPNPNMYAAPSTTGQPANQYAPQTTAMPAAGNAPVATQPMVPPQNVPGAYNPQTVPQNPANAPVRRPTTPPAPPAGMNAGPAPVNETVAPAAPAPTNPMVAPVGPADDVPF